jgi:hypothetical protein
MNRDEHIENLQERLHIHRANVATLLKQIAFTTFANAPVEKINSLEREREQIAQLKLALLVCGVEVSNHPDDGEEPPFIAERRLERQLLEIDFVKPVQKCKQVFEQLERDGGAALFVIQNSLNMGGEWLSKRLQNLLKDPTMPQSFSSQEVNFLRTDVLDGITFLRKIKPTLEKEFKKYTAEDYINPSAEFKKRIDDIIEFLCKKLKNSRTLYIDISIWSEIAQGEQFFSWFMHNIWVALLKAVVDIINAGELPQIRLIILIQCYSLIPDACLEQLLHSMKLEYTSIDELQLANWTIDEIETWLRKYSHLVDPLKRLSTLKEIQDQAKSLFRVSDEGMPYKVYNFLLKDFKDNYGRINYA